MIRGSRLLVVLFASLMATTASARTLHEEFKETITNKKVFAVLQRAGIPQNDGSTQNANPAGKGGGGGGKAYPPSPPAPPPLISCPIVSVL
jgi:hypothetical protein